MIEILVSGNPTKDFKRLGVAPKGTYANYETRYLVYEVTDEDFKTLCDEPDIDNTWEDCGWRHCEGSNQGIPNAILNINGKNLNCWYKPLDENEGEIIEEGEPLDYYHDLLEYLCNHMGASMFQNVCALATDLAKYNNMKLSKLFEIYQG